MTELIQYLNSIHTLSPELVEHLSNILKKKEVLKSELLLKHQAICKNIYFIQKGLFRCFYLKDNDKEVSSWFMKTGDVIISVESFFKQIPSNENIQALEDSSVYFISYTELEFIYKKFLEFNFIGRFLTEKYYCESEQRLFWLRMNSAKEKYNLLLKNYPELIHNISSTHIASFLGITLETLSRMKGFKK